MASGRPCVVPSHQHRCAASAVPVLHSHLVLLSPTWFQHSDRPEIEYHPYVATHLQPLLDLHAQHFIITQAYASLVPTTRHTGGPLDPILERIAAELSGGQVSVDASGVLLLWVMAKGGVCITSSSDEARIAKMASLENVRDLTEDEVREIDEAGAKVHFRQWVCLHRLPRCAIRAGTGTV